VIEPLVDAHCHLWIQPPEGADGPRLVAESLAERELAAFRDVGGTAVIDCQPGGCGRDGRVLARLAETTGISIAPATGFHLERYYDPSDSPYGADPDALAERWGAELAGGLAEAPTLRARVVKSAWTGDGGDRERAMIIAAAEAARSEGAALVVHTERGAGAEELAALIAETGLAPGRAQLSHVDKRPDPGLHLELARAGFVLGYDAFLRPRYRPLETTWPLLERLASEGLWAQITVGLDVVDPALWSVCGGEGLPAIGHSILPELRARAGEREARALTGANAIRLLDGAEVAV
jgi:phosphotriesterase-related protein